MVHIFLSLHAANKSQGLRKAVLYQVVDTEESDSSSGCFDFEGWDSPVNDTESFELPGKI